jgi:hypothetical protein
MAQQEIASRHPHPHCGQPAAARGEWHACMMACSAAREMRAMMDAQEEMRLTMPAVVVVECILLCFALPFCGIRSPCRRVVK